MAPDFGPARVAVAVDGRAIGVGGGLIVSLQKENFRDAIVGEGAVLVDVERLVELSQRASKVTLLLHRLTAKNRRAQLHVGRIREHMMVGVDGDAARASEGFDGER